MRELFGLGLRSLLPLVLWLPAASAHRGPAAQASAQDAAVLGWNDEWWLWLLVAASAWLYVQGVVKLWRCAGRGTGISVARAAGFMGGWLCLVIALLSPLDAMGGVLFSAHMAQHELLMLGAAPLLAAGRPLGAFVWGLPAGWRRPVWALCTRTGAARAVAFLSRPLVAWSVHAAAIWLWHAPALFEAAVRHEGVHVAQHLSFFVSAVLFWWALLKPGATTSGALAALYVLTTAIHTAVLGALLTFAPNPIYPVYATTAPAWGMSALEDQQLGGLIMWVPAGMAYLVIALWLLAGYLRMLEARSVRPSC